MKNYRKSEEQIEEELLRFVEFGAVLDRKTRLYFVNYLKQKISLEVDLENLKEGYFNYFKSALDNLFLNETLINVVQNQKVLGLQVVSDVTNWFSKTYQKVAKKNPYENELSSIEGWSARPLQNAFTQWPYLVKDIESYYVFEDFDGCFYRNKIKSLLGENSFTNTPKEILEEFSLVITDLLSKWDALLQAKILAYQLKHLEKEGETFADELNQKAKDFEKLTNMLNPFVDYVGRYWDLSQEPWKDTTFDVIDAYDKLLQNEKELENLANLLGKMRQAEIETEEEIFERVEIKQEEKVDPNQKTEITEIKAGDDLNNLETSEINLLINEETETLFLKKFAEKSLLVKGFEDKVMVSSSKVLYETNQKVKLKEKGPFIVCVDTSGSMEGNPEQIAKVLCFGILKMASKENRKAYLINFSTGIKTIDLLDISRNLDALADFLSFSFQGGTDISLALHEALSQLKREEYKDADVLVISDFIMYKIEKDLVEGMEFTKHHLGTQYHNITLNNQANLEILDLFDNHWVYDPKEKRVVKSVYKNLIEL